MKANQFSSLRNERSSQLKPLMRLVSVTKAGASRRFRISALFLVSLLTTSCAFAAADPPTAPVTPAKPATTPTPAQSETVGPVANPNRTVRGGKILVSLAGAPKDAHDVSLSIDGILIPAEKTDTDSIFQVSIPDATDSHDPKFIPLGKHRIAMAIDGQRFTGDNYLIVDSEVPHPVLTSINPTYLVRGSNATLTLTGSHFLTDAPSDNEILFDSLPLPVVWDGCDPNKPFDAKNTNRTHGAVGQDGTTITLCNLQLPGKTSAEVNVRQGTYQTDSHLQLNLTSWARWQVVWTSIGVLALCFAVVIILGYVGSRYSIADEKFGVWTLLFLDIETDTFSLSKLQFYLWTGAAVLTYAYLVIGRYFIQHGVFPDVPSSLPGILAIGAGTAIGSQLVTNVRGPKGGGQEKPNLSDFVTSGGVAAADRVQMLVWTIVGVLGFCAATFYVAPWDIQDLPKIGDSLMLLMGISSAGYLGGKLARKPGPVLSEIALTPGVPDGDAASSQKTTTKADFSVPVAAAEQICLKANTALAQPPQSLSATAVTAVHNALVALQSALDAAKQGKSDVLATIAASATSADAASRILAAEYRDLVTGNAEVAKIEATRTHAELAQELAHAIQKLATGVSQALGAAQRSESDCSSTSPVRTIELRGRNLSADATFEINDAQLPFRMLVPIHGVKVPEVIAPEDDKGNANLSKGLRLTIDPATLGPSDRDLYNSWFKSGSQDLKFTIFNPDGQKSELSVKLPPGSQLARSAAEKSNS